MLGHGQMVHEAKADAEIAGRRVYCPRKVLLAQQCLYYVQVLQPCVSWLICWRQLRAVVCAPGLKAHVARCKVALEAQVSAGKVQYVEPVLVVYGPGFEGRVAHAFPARPGRLTRCAKGIVHAAIKPCVQVVESSCRLCVHVPSIERRLRAYNGTLWKMRFWK